MKKHIKWASAFAMLAVGSSVNADFVDLFTDPAAGQSVSEVAAGSSTFSEVGNFPATILGGFRDLNVDLIAGGVDLNTNGICDVGDSCTVLTQFNGTLTFNNATGVNGVGTVQYDGNDAAATLDVTGLGGLNLRTQAGCPVGGCDRFRFTVIEADLGFDFQIRLFTDAMNFTDVNIASNAVPAGSPVDREILFAALENAALCGAMNVNVPGVGLLNSVTCGGGGGNMPVDLNNLGSLELVFNSQAPNGGTTAVDLQIGAITKEGNVPEPANIALMGLGLIALGYRRRKKVSA